MILNCIEYSCCHFNSNDSNVFTYIVAISTIIITIYVVYLSKRVDLKVEKFNKLCLDPLLANFSLQEDFIKNNGSETVSSKLMNLNELNNDLTILFSIIHQSYPSLNVNELQDITHEYTDSFFHLQNQLLYEIQGDLLKTKIRILDKIYNHVYHKEISIFS